MDFRLCRTRGEGRRLLYSVGFNVVLAAEHHVLIRISQRPPQKSDERHVLISYQGDFLIRGPIRIRVIFLFVFFGTIRTTQRKLH